MYYFQNESDCFIGVSKHREQMKSERSAGETLHEWFRTKTCFDTEAKGNSEMENTSQTS